MKKISVILSLALLPLMPAEGKGPHPVRDPVRVGEPQVRIDVRQGSAAALNVKEKGPIVGFPGCKGTCATSLEGLLSVDARRDLNREIDRSGAYAEVIGPAMQTLPAVNLNMQIEYNPVKANELTDALVAVAIELPEWKDPQASKNYVQFTKTLATGNPRDHEKKIRQIKEDCILPSHR